MAEILPICGLSMTDALAEEEQELKAIVESLDKIITRYRMEIRAEKTKVMRTALMASKGRQVKRQKLGTVISFKYSQLSLSRLRLSRITAYLEEKIWFLL